jgi:hypothetical protein
MTCMYAPTRHPIAGKCVVLSDPERPNQRPHIEYHHGTWKRAFRATILKSSKGTHEGLARVAQDIKSSIVASSGLLLFPSFSLILPTRLTALEIS